MINFSLQSGRGGSELAGMGSREGEEKGDGLEDVGTVALV